jgi:hypothetical protein
VFAEQVLKALVVFGDYFALAGSDPFPIDLGLAALDSEVLTVPDGAVDLCVEEQSFRRDATHVQAGSSQSVILFDDSRP